MAPPLTFTAVPGIPDIRAGDDLVQIIAGAMSAAGLELKAGDVLVVAQKIVSKAEGRLVDLNQVEPSGTAQKLAAQTGKDARLVELILSESSKVVRAVRGVLIVRHRLGYVMANAGIDHSNIQTEDGTEQVLLLPVDADVSAAALRDRFQLVTGIAPGIIVSDSFGRPWRNGVVNVALGAAGLPSLIDRRGEQDLYGHRLESTVVAFADAIAAGAGLCMGEGAEGMPVITGMPSAPSPMHRPAPAAMASAKATTVLSSRWPYRSCSPRRSISEGNPAAPSATLTTPLRQGRPKLSLTMMPGAMPVTSWNRSRSAAADTSASTGSSSTCSVPSSVWMLEWSMPALAI